LKLRRKKEKEKKDTGNATQPISSCILAHLAGAFIQSDLQRVRRQQYIAEVHKDKNRAGSEHS